MVLAIFILFTTLFAPSISFGADLWQSVPANQLEQNIAKHLSDVDEFKLIREEAERLGVKVYLTGEGASGYAHYVRWNTLRENGDTHYFPSYFDFTYSNIYPDNTRVGFAADGTSKNVQALQSFISKRFPHLTGENPEWRVQALTELKPHDGLIELTKPEPGESVVHDAQNRKSSASQFLQDVSQGTIHPFSEKEGEAPIISAVRYLDEAFQRDLKISPHDFAQLKKIVDALDLQSPEMKNSAVRDWLLYEDNAKNLVTRSMNLEHSWNTLETLGLRKKLIDLDNRVSQKGSTSWLLNREPLRSFPLDSGGRTLRRTGDELAKAGKIPKLILAHRAPVEAYQSMTRPPNGELNALISRSSAVGEAALKGDGFYASAKDTGLATLSGVDLVLDLEGSARSGQDFKFVSSGVLFKNKSALHTRLIPQPEMSPLEYFRRSSQGNTNDYKAKLSKRRVLNQTYKMTPENHAEIEKYLTDMFSPRSNGFILSKEHVIYGDNLEFIAKITGEKSPFGPTFTELVRETLVNSLKDSSSAAFLLQHPRVLRAYGITHQDEVAGISEAVESLKKYPCEVDSFENCYRYQNRKALLDEIFRSQNSNYEPALKSLISTSQEMDLRKIAENVLSRPNVFRTPETAEALVSRLSNYKALNPGANLELLHYLKKQVFNQEALKGWPATERFLQAERQRAIRSGEHIVVGIFGDSHGNQKAVEKVFQAFKENHVTHVIGTGDYTERGGVGDIEDTLKKITPITSVPKEKIFLMSGNWEEVYGIGKTNRILRKYGNLISDRFDSYGFVNIGNHKIMVSHYPQHSLPEELLPPPQYRHLISNHVELPKDIDFEIFAHTHKLGSYIEPHSGKLSVNVGTLHPAKKVVTDPAGFGIYRSNNNTIELYNAENSELIRTVAVPENYFPPTPAQVTADQCTTSFLKSLRSFFGP